MNHRNDVMKLLADARPASLDPEPDAGRRTHDVAATVAAGSELDSDGRSRAPLAVSWRHGRSRPLVTARSARRTTFGLGMALTAIAAAFAVLVATAGHGAPPPTRHVTGARPGQTALSPSAVLLVAASNAAKTPSSGRYWRTITTSATIDSVGPPGNPYRIEIRARQAIWDAQSPSDRSWTISQILGAHPANAADDAAWRRDGSPTSWYFALMKPITGEDRIGMTPVPAQASWQDANGAVGSLGKDRLNLRQLQALPTDPARLESVLRQHIVAVPVIRSKVAPSDDVSLFYMGAELLNAPVTSQVRAAVFRMLATLSGVRAVGQVRDPLGRTGYGFAVPMSPIPGSEELVVIDPATGSMLAREDIATRSGAEGGTLPAGGKVLSAGSGYTVNAEQVVSYMAVVKAGWTDATPKLPTVQHGPGGAAG